MSSKIFQFKIHLFDIKPVIWRRIQVLSTDTFANFHDIIQNSMGWKDCHLHEFFITKNTNVHRIGTSDEYDDFGEPTEDEMRVTLSKIFTQEQQKVVYVYDFGDDWRHEIILEKILSADEKPYPRCIDGERACPPEDCGGPWGYENLLEILGDPKHEEYKNMMDWCGKIDPEAFSIEATNKLLQKYRT